MNINHFHVYVSDFSGAIEWLEHIWQIQPVYKDNHMAIFSLGSVTMLLEISDHDIPCIIGFASENCDMDYKKVMQRGAISLEEPTDKKWGVRMACIKGPGMLKFEIEQEF